MYIPDPICCKYSFFSNLNYNSFICSSIGKYGLTTFHLNRKYIMLILSFLAIISTITSLIPVISITTNKEIIKDLYWTKGSNYHNNNDNNNGNNDIQVFISLKAVLEENNDNLKLHLWKDTNCTNLSLYQNNYCQQCEDACEKTIRVAIINFITSIPIIIINLKRSTVEGDLNCQKIMAILTGIIGTITTLTSISFYLDGCFRHLPEYTVDGQEIHYSLGPGFICILIPQILKPIDVIVNILTPVGSRVAELPEYDHRLLVENDDESTVEL